ncbi:hypothetical protein QPM17_22850 [Marinobacter sp. TBZ242]|uniref:CHASE domain-containing protein n=1 Tax=Marinobacter azerbaijanicus TaxID=3050455 RepID=A0ABT7IIH4_9GAMM|nr:hypothetical protein [Marinobacter sp. TBZ242]MDL0433984.1 hypothetical protein [Marinobacter sp. TBZ242]
MKLKEAAEIIKRDATNAWIRRVNWRFMDQRIQTEFESVASDKDSLNLLGGLYISRAKDNDPIRKSNLIISQHINSTHIFTGHRLLGISVIDPETKALKIASERNAQLWYSQGPSGDVLVFVGPYQSDAGKIEENEIIIGKYHNPSQITAQRIRKHFSIFLKYCSCTAQHSASSLSNYLYRKYLVFNDFRYKSTYRQKLIVFAERILILALGGAAVWASLYVGGKI